MTDGGLSPSGFDPSRVDLDGVIHLIEMSTLRDMRDAVRADRREETVSLVNAAMGKMHAAYELERFYRGTASGIAAGTDETAQQAQPEGQEPVPQGDAQ